MGTGVLVMFPLKMQYLIDFQIFSKKSLNNKLQPITFELLLIPLFL